MEVLFSSVYLYLDKMRFFGIKQYQISFFIFLRLVFLQRKEGQQQLFYKVVLKSKCVDVCRVFYGVFEISQVYSNCQLGFDLVFYVQMRYMDIRNDDFFGGYFNVSYRKLMGSKIG